MKPAMKMADGGDQRREGRLVVEPMVTAEYGDSIQWRLNLDDVPFGDLLHY